MAKKKDLPYMPFYFGDWRKAPEIRALNLATRMIWFEMLGYMWESTERGYLTLNGKPIAIDVISRMIGIDISIMQIAIKELEQFEVFSSREDGAMFCRKMIRDEQIRKTKSIAGKKGMKKRYNKKTDTKQPEIIIENEVDIWKNDERVLYEDTVWFEQNVLMKTKLPKPEIRKALTQYWLRLREKNWIGDLKMCRSGFQKWLNTWESNNEKEKIKSNGKSTRKGQPDTANAVNAAEQILREHAENKNAGASNIRE